MTVDKNDVDFMSAPKDYGELFSTYYGYVVALVRKNGIAESNKEDVAVEILTRLLERDFLTLFDPTLKFTHDGQTRKARFKTFLSYAVIDYCRGHRDKQKRLGFREMLIMDKPTAYDEIDSTWAEWWGVEATESHEEAILELVAGEQFMADIREYLATVPRRGAFDRCDLVKLFDAVLAQIALTNTVCVRELKEHFGISGTGINGWMWWLRANIAEFLGVDLPPKRIRKKTP